MVLVVKINPFNKSIVLATDEAQWATQMAVWIHAKALGIEHNTVKSIDVNDMNFDNPSVGNYLKNY